MSIQETEEENDNQIQQQEQQQQQSKKKEKEKGNGHERRLRGAKNLIMSPIRNLVKAYSKRKKRKPPPPPPPFPYSEDSSGDGCYLCFMQPKASSDSNPDAETSSYPGFLRSLIERNDFYSPDCNVHLHE